MPRDTAVQLQPDEAVKLILHRHWFVLLGKTIIDVLLFFVPIILLFTVMNKTISLGTISITPQLPPTISFFIIGIWGTFVWMRFFNQWTDHYLDGWIVTDKRIIDVEQRGFFSRQVSSFRIERIQDITTDIHGIIATLLDFGDVHVQTASADHDFIIKGAPKPRQVKEMILRESDRTIDSNKIDDAQATASSSL